MILPRLLLLPNPTPILPFLGYWSATKSFSFPVLFPFPFLSFPLPFLSFLFPLFSIPILPHPFYSFVFPQPPPCPGHVGGIISSHIRAIHPYRPAPFRTIARIGLPPRIWSWIRIGIGGKWAFIGNQQAYCHVCNQPTKHLTGAYVLA